MADPISADARLRIFIAGELVKARVSEKNIAVLTSDVAMETWTAAFTHSTITGIPGQNYEGLETLGDAYIAAFFFSYVDSILPRAERTPSYYTELRRYWLGKKQLAKFSEEVGFVPYIRVDPRILASPDENAREDVFEAFFGALITVTDNLINPGVGFIYGYNYFDQLIAQHDILLSEDAIFPRKTKLKELFDGLLWGAVRYVPVGAASSEQVSVAVLDNEGDELSRGSGRDRGSAEDVAAAAAIRELERQGISRESITAKRPVDREEEELKRRISTFLARKGNYGALELVRTYKEPKTAGSSQQPRTLIELRTTQDVGTEKELLVQLSKGFGSNRQARIEALRSYITTHRIP